ncbi:glycosyltransferase family 2 protein [Ralstonia sp. TCR112]|uniref:glycosyltransferase n=1 Tax=Ralstonia sp. TCR112 TaxID=2601730 RepID=UPI0011BEBDA9|nr:glycosyltransferase family 2 protein [Ralstonia sp. TCR112]TXD57015.1 glycosyltransferase family 2 protein [Ralstonia sp. TCR112]
MSNIGVRDGDAGDHESSVPEITISIVSHRQAALVRPLLAQLRALSAKASLHVIVTQNLPEDRIPVEESDTFQVTWLVNAVPAGFGANHNAAFAHCQSNCFLVLNPDVRLGDDSVLRLVSHLAEHPGVVGPRVVTPSGSLEDSARRVPTPARLVRRWLLRRFEPDYDASIQFQPVDWIAGMCMAFDRDSFSSVGGFDNRFHLYCEDVDICLRLQLSGLQVSWLQSAVVVHDAQRASHRKWRYLVWHLQSMAQLMTSVAYWQFRLRGRHFS